MRSDRAYDPDRYVYAPPRARQEPARSPAVQASDRVAAPEAVVETKPPSSLGCWLLPQAAKNPSGGSEQVKSDRNPHAAQTLIVARNAPIGGTAAFLEEQPYHTDFDNGEELVSTGALVNTWTGEVSQLFENAIPPPDLTRGDVDVPRENRQRQLRLEWAMGGEKRARQKQEFESVIPAGDAGPLSTDQRFRQEREIAMEGEERSRRDQYMNRSELIPTELQPTRNPYGDRGFQNLVRINPHVPATQPLPTKGWMPNAA